MAQELDPKHACESQAWPRFEEMPVSWGTSARRAGAARGAMRDIGALEGTALWCILRATGVQLDLIQTMILVGAATLSTLIPTAPGFLGSYQFVFAMTLPLFGFTEASGIVAATLMQLFLFGSVTLLGLSIYVFSGVYGAITTIRISQD